LNDRDRIKEFIEATDRVMNVSIAIDFNFCSVEQKRPQTLDGISVSVFFEGESIYLFFLLKYKKKVF